MGRPTCQKSPAGSALRRLWRNRLRGRVRQPARVVCGCELVKAELAGSKKNTFRAASWLTETGHLDTIATADTPAHSVAQCAHNGAACKRDVAAPKSSELS